jgi:RNase P/RNase MRP subunit p29
VKEEGHKPEEDEKAGQMSDGEDGYTSDGSDGRFVDFTTNFLKSQFGSDGVEVVESSPNEVQVETEENQHIEGDGHSWKIKVDSDVAEIRIQRGKIPVCLTFRGCSKAKSNLFLTEQTS